MGVGELLIICISAFVAVFVILTILALVMRLILVIFPHRTTDSDWAVIAAVASAASAAFPGMKVTHVEESK